MGLELGLRPCSPQSYPVFTRSESPVFLRISWSLRNSSCARFVEVASYVGVLRGSLVVHTNRIQHPHDYSWFKRWFYAITLWIPEVLLIILNPSPNKSWHYTFDLAKPNFDLSSLPRLNIRHTAGMSFNGGCKTNWQILVSSWRISQLWRQQILAKISQDTWLVSPARQVHVSVACWMSLAFSTSLDVTGCILTRGYPVPGTKKGCQMKEAIYAPIYGDCGMKLNQINNLWTLTHSLNSCLILNENRLTMI